MLPLPPLSFYAGRTVHLANTSEDLDDGYLTDTMQGEKRALLSKDVMKQELSGEMQNRTKPDLLLREAALFAAGQLVFFYSFQILSF